VVLSGLAAFVVVLMCLFPLAPIWMKKIVLYTCISILGVFFFIFVVRTAVFAVVWLLTGRHFWILPNITSDEIPIDEVFSPMWEFDDLDASGNVVGRINAVKRLGLAGALTAVLVGLYKIAPENTKAINIHKAHDSILDLFDLNDVPKGIAGSTASGAKLDPQDPANIARMDKMRREAGGAGSRVTVEDVDGVNGTSTENGENATEPTGAQLRQAARAGQADRGDDRGGAGGVGGGGGDPQGRRGCSQEEGGGGGCESRGGGADGAANRTREKGGALSDAGGGGGEEGSAPAQHAPPSRLGDQEGAVRKKIWMRVTPVSYPNQS
jgi:translocation protein SEC62